MTWTLQIPFHAAQDGNPDRDDPLDAAAIHKLSRTLNGDPN